MRLPGDPSPHRYPTRAPHGGRPAAEADRLTREQPPPPSPPRVSAQSDPPGLIARQLLGGRVVK